MKISCPFKKIAKELSETLGKEINLDKDWGLFLPAALEPILGSPPKNVYYSIEEKQAFFAPLPQKFLTAPELIFNHN